MRIEPAPSDAEAPAQRPAATAAPLPPLDPPGVWATFQGLRVTPQPSDSVSPMIASSGSLVFPRITAPAAAQPRGELGSPRGPGSPYATVPWVVMSPARSWLSFSAIGTPSSGLSSPAARRESAWSASARARSGRRRGRSSAGDRSARSGRGTAPPARARRHRRPRTSSACLATPAKAARSNPPAEPSRPAQPWPRPAPRSPRRDR